MYQEFTFINKCISGFGTEIRNASVKDLREAFNTPEENILEAYTAQRWEEVRSQRDKLLSECDWVVTKATDTGESIPTAWQEYRQALRDITNQADPDEIVWPTKP